ncbi:MAG: 6-phosphogluconolactonase [Burkholderiaceae bacterium]
MRDASLSDRAEHDPAIEWAKARVVVAALILNRALMTIEIKNFFSPRQAADALASAIAVDLTAALANRVRALLLVSGGRSPVQLFHSLANQSLAWERIDISVVDERSVPPDTHDSNAALVRATLTVGAARAARWIPLMPADVFAAACDPWVAAQQAALLANGNPLLKSADVVVLGMGTDGHTASLFPDAPQWPQARTTRARYVAIQPQQAPYTRVSLSLCALQQQARCYMWLTGEEKVAALARLQALYGAVAIDALSAESLATAGPVACLIADPKMVLETFCSIAD